MTRMTGEDPTAKEAERRAAGQPVDLERAYQGFTETWAPRIAATVDDYDVKIAKVAGEYVWHTHADTDEFFLVLSGELTLGLQGRDPVRLGPLQAFTVPRGVRHRPSATEGTRILFLERRGTLNSGDADLTGASWVPVTTGVALSENGAVE